MVEGVLRAQVLLNQQAALTVAARMALIKGDIQALDHALITGWVKGQQHLTLDGKAAHCHDLSLMDATLTGVVLIAADLEVSRQASP